LILAYSFNHAEAAHSFKEAVRQDPDCASCYWGLAYVLGPIYNSKMKNEVLPETQEAHSNARMKANKCSPKENALIIWTNIITTWQLSFKNFRVNFFNILKDVFVWNIAYTAFIHNPL
jgi:hypothetical protein